MKRITSIFILLFYCLSAFEQDNALFSFFSVKDSRPIIYIGSSTGMNNMNGFLGAFGEINLYEDLTFCGALGLSNWGYKYTGGIRYYEYYPFRTFYGLSFSGFSGADSSVFLLDVENSDELREVVFDLKPSYCLNLTIGYQFNIFNLIRMHLELGYSIPLLRNPYEIITPDIELSDYGEQLLDFYIPGGVYLGGGLSIGF